MAEYDIEKARKLLETSNPDSEARTILASLREQIRAAYEKGMSIRRIHKLLNEAGQFPGSLPVLSSWMKDAGIVASQPVKASRKKKATPPPKPVEKQSEKPALEGEKQTAPASGVSGGKAKILDDLDKPLDPNLYK